MLSMDHQTAMEVAILIGDELYSLVSVFLVTGVPANVTCTSNSIQQTVYYVDILLPDPPITVTNSATIRASTTMETG